jgi:hypothetical protein
MEIFMTSACSEDTPPVTDKPSGFVRVMQVIGAVCVTAFALWFLFGIPAYLLFGIFFE